MDPSATSLSVDVRVTLSDFCAVYTKHTNQPQLILKRRLSLSSS
jgi:hypothetical protein